MMRRRNEPARQREIERFLRTGDHDLLFRSWPGAHALDRIERGSRALAEALRAEVRRRLAGVPLRMPAALHETDVVAFTRNKVAPMVRGFFPAKERHPVLAVLEKSLVFLTPEAVDALIGDGSELESAWLAANICLNSVGAEPFTEKASVPLGFSEETTCYVSLAYFDAQDPFADFVVHEAAHVFHNTKRRTIGLHGTRRRVWLLQIDLAKRETFAYACEVYSRILELGKRSSDRKELFERFRRRRPPPGGMIDFGDLLDMLEAAVGRRNGWTSILEGCSSKARTS